ncbi:MAG: response regulator transcription factor [Clostridia bacterium]
MDQAKILLVEDDSKIARFLKLELEYEGYELKTAEDGVTGFELFTGEDWDLILLDVMIPKLSGMEVLRRIRAADRITPVILLTARDSLPDKVSGLDLGANDYITKPFAIEELLARIRVSMRMSRMIRREEESEQLCIADLCIEEKTRTVTRGGTHVELTPREFDLLVYMMKHANQVLNRDQILTNVWGFDYYGDTNVVDVYIRYLRKKLDDPHETPLIHTVRGIGYVLKGSGL